MKLSTIVIIGAILFILMSEKEGINSGTGSGSGTTTGGGSYSGVGSSFKFGGELDDDYNSTHPNVANRDAATFMSQSPESGIPASANPAEMLLVSGRGRVSGIRHASYNPEPELLQSTRENQAFKNFASSRY
jgi:hypothetical protein